MPGLRVFVAMAAVAILAPLYSRPALAATVKVEWNAPASNEDGSNLTDLAGFIVYYGRSKRRMKKAIDVGLVTSHTVSGLRRKRRRHFVAVTAYDDSGNESKRSSKLLIRRRHLQKRR